MKFMNHKKSRVTDLFRKMDTDNDGAVPREDFVEGIIKTSKRIFLNIIINKIQCFRIILIHLLIFY